MRKLLVSLIFVLFAAVFVGSAAHAQIFTPEYHKRDAGYLVISMSGGKSMKYKPIVLFYQSLDGREHGSVRYDKPDLLNPLSRRPDFRAADETGVVVVRGLKPGRYVFDSFLTHWTNKSFEAHFKMPFEIRPGETTYVGNFRFVEKPAEGFTGFAQARDVYFVVRDKSRRDMAIARRKKPTPHGRLNNMVPDVAMINHPLFKGADAPILNP
jgi:hypothetical protein